MIKAAFMLAQATNPTEQFLGSWVAAAMVVLAGITALFGIVEFFATKREVKTLQERVASAEQDLKELRDKLDRDKTEVICAGSERAKNLHIRIDELQIQLGTVNGQFQAQIGAINGQLKNVTELLSELVKAKIHEK
jgi:predicted nuclease with TOPRIM domain